MGCSSPKTSSLIKPNDRKEDVVLRIPRAGVFLMGDTQPVELGKGDLTILRITEGGIVLATVIKIGSGLQWPLTKDEPIIKLDQLHYLFTLPDADGGFLNYGVSFAGRENRLASLDSFLKDNACFSTAADITSSSSAAPSSYEVYWKDYAPKIEDYNGALAKAIVGGTGEIVKGIFKCSNIYSSQVKKGAELVRPQAAGSQMGATNGDYRANKRTDANTKPGEINKSIRRVRKLSEMVENMSRSLLGGVLTVTGSAAIPLVQSKAGQTFLASVPGEVLLASFDAVNKVLDAVEVAERKTIAATSNVVAGAVSQRFGESAGEATEDAFATAGHVVGTAWNIFKIRKAIKPSSVRSSMLRSAVKNKI